MIYHVSLHRTNDRDSIQCHLRMVLVWYLSKTRSLHHSELIMTQVYILLYIMQEGTEVHTTKAKAWAMAETLPTISPWG
jgi:hypothetical protein